jgi:hypothetical protein
MITPRAAYVSPNESGCKEEVMSSNEVSIDMKLEAVVIPVSDVDRAKEFYSRLD